MAETEDYHLHPELLAKQAEGLTLDVQPSANYFEFARDPDKKGHPAGHRLHFGCQLLSMRCLYDNVGGKQKQCGRRAVVGVGYCSGHLNKVFGLKVADSTVAGAGKGLFATRAFKAGDANVAPKYCSEQAEEACSMPYWGQMITGAEGDRRYGKHDTAPYGISIDRSKTKSMVDAACLRGFGSIINHSFDKSKVNCIFAWRHPNPYPTIEFLKDVQKGQELFIDYGESYWTPSEKNAGYSNRKGVLADCTGQNRTCTHKYQYARGTRRKKRSPAYLQRIWG